MPNRRVIVVDGTKECSRCRTWKPLEDFGTCSTNSSGRQSRCKRCWRDVEYQRLYGITVGEYERLFERQRGRCAICKQTSREHLAVDHDHRTGHVRGLLCKSCNQLLGRIGDDLETARNIVRYLAWSLYEQQANFSEDLSMLPTTQG